MSNRVIYVCLTLLFFFSSYSSANETTQDKYENVFCGYEYANSEILIDKLYYADSEEQKEKLAKLTYTTYSGTHKVEEIPTIGLKIKEGWLVGSSYFDGEDIQRGALAYLNFQNEPTKLLNEPVEDIYVMPFGYVVIAGGVRTFSPQIRAFDVGFGSVYVVQIKNKTATIEKLHELIEEPRSSWKTKNGDIVINFQKSSTLLNEHASLKSIICSDYKYQEQ